VIPANITISDVSLKTTFFGLYFCRSNHFYVIRPASYRIR